jgi:hypothetical protein
MRNQVALAFLKCLEDLLQVHRVKDQQWQVVKIKDQLLAVLL